ncbi:MAG: hypothetical protein RL042_1163 [Nitrospirota bacterium]|jgi:hypothetical protein
MAALAGNLTSVGNPFNWNLFFAREPEPDLDFTEEELDQATSTRASGPLNPRKKPGGGRPILLMLLLVFVSGIAYVATMEPEMLADWLSPYLGESTPPPVAMKPKPPAHSPAPQATPKPSDTAPAPVSPGPAATASVAPATSAVPPPSATAKSPAPAAPYPAPVFGEGQKVTVMADPSAPGGNISLYADSTGNKPGPLVRAGVTLTVLDGDLQPGGWIYLLRTEEGTKGWVSEKRLRLKT